MWSTQDGKLYKDENEITDFEEVVDNLNMYDSVTGMLQAGLIYVLSIFASMKEIK